MIKMKTKRLLMFVSAVMLISSVLFTACAPEQTTANDINTSSVEDTSAPDDGSTVPEETTQEKYQFPGENYGGYEMRVIVPDHNDWAMSTIRAAADVNSPEEENGDPLNDAIYKRNRTIEDGLGVTIKEILVSGPESRAKKSILANTDEYDVIFTDSVQAGSLASQGLYLNLYNVPGLNLDKSYWNQNAHQSAELLGKLYFTTSDSNIITNDAIWVIYFNKKINQNLGLGDPYQLVRDGKWTIDVMYDMARSAAKDLDGDGKFTVSDQWGISTHNLGFLAFLECQNESIVKLNEKNEPYLVSPSDRFVNAFVKAHQMMNKEGGVFLDAQGSYPGKNADLDHAKKTFMADMSLFCAEVLAHSRVFREMTADFGIIPHPKYDEKQENYYTFMIDTIPAFGIPITVADPDRSGTFMDAFTAVSNETIIPAYYTISLEGKFTRDEDSIEMLDIIRDGRIFDLAVLYNWGGIHSALQTYGCGAEGTNPITVFEKNEGKVNTAIEKTMTAYMEMD